MFGNIPINDKLKCIEFKLNEFSEFIDVQLDYFLDCMNVFIRLTVNTLEQHTNRYLVWL